MSQWCSVDVKLFCVKFLVGETEVSEGLSRYEAMQMLTILQPYPTDTDNASLALPGKIHVSS